MLKLEKRALRQKMMQIGSEIPEVARVEASRQIAEKVIEFVEQKGFLRIFCYISYRNEVQTHDLLYALQQREIETFVPCILEEKMWAVRWCPGMPMRKNRWGILEPQKIEIAKAVDCALLPGVAFGKDGSRLGMAEVIMIDGLRKIVVIQSAFAGPGNYRRAFRQKSMIFF